METEDDSVNYENLYKAVENENINLRLFILKMKNSSESFIERATNILIDLGIERVIYIVGLLFSLFIVPVIGLYLSNKKESKS